MKALKKSALVLALAAAAAGAQAAEVYGTVDAGYSYTSVEGADLSTISSGGLSDSFIGFRSAEDLGGGLKASFALEAGVNVDTGTTAGSNLFNREASVGLSQGIHSVKLGRTQTLSYGTVKQYDVFNGASLGFARGAFDTAGEYQSNTVSYGLTTGGLTVGLSHALGEQVDGGLDKGSVSAVNVGYNLGKASVGLTYTDAKDGASNVLVGGAYDFGPAKVTALYQDSKNSAQDNSFVVGVAAPVKGVTLKASAGYLKMVDGSKADLFTVGAEHSLSKRTTAYVAAGRVSGDLSADTFSIGVNHKF